MNSDKFDELMSASTYAQAGEHEEARRIMRGRERVLLAVSDVYFDSGVFSYALNICKRTVSCLDIIYLTRTERHLQEIEEFIEKASSAGVSCRVVKKDGCMKQVILDYTTNNRSVLFVVVGTSPELDLECKSGERSLTDAWKKLRCPLVLVSKGELPSTA